MKRVGLQFRMNTCLDDVEQGLDKPVICDFREMLTKLSDLSV